MGRKDPRLLPGLTEGCVEVGLRVPGAALGEGPTRPEVAFLNHEDLACVVEDQAAVGLDHDYRESRGGNQREGR
eukprot:6044467-Alexandrium_andersonii.AAC.1